jgi:peptide/nickel transport system substrate-binding protein
MSYDFPRLRRTAAAAIAVLVTATACSSIDSPETTQSTAPDNRPLRSGGELRIALSAEPDALDPTLARTLVGRIVFNAICEKLYDVDEDLAIVPQLAAELPQLSVDGTTATVKLRTGLKFADGTTMDATAVKTSLDRHRTLKGSGRTSELSSVEGVDVIDPATVAIRLKAPFAPLTAVLADRAGMVMSPAALTAKGDKFGTDPVCIGPFKFASRIAQDRIEVVKDPNYYDAGKVLLDKVIYRIIADATTRFNNLRSGDVEVLDTLNPTDVDALKADPKLRLLTSESLGYQGITVNVGNANGLGTAPAPLAAPYAGPAASDARVRRAFELSLDRDGINKVVFRGQFSPACGPISPESPLSSDAAQACPPHDPAQAKRLLGEAGVPTPLKVGLVISNTPQERLLGEAIQAQAREGGFEVELQPTEFSASLDQTDAGRFQMFRIGWSGRVDPDGNIATFLTTKGGQNVSGYSNTEVDRLIEEARSTSDEAKRRELYGQLLTRVRQDAPLIYLYRQKNLTGVLATVGGVRVFGDGILRFGTAGFVA